MNVKSGQSARDDFGMKTHLLSILAFMVASFAAQGLSHFVVNGEHFAAIPFMRPDPIIPLGLLVMIFQGATISIALHRWRGGAATLSDGVLIAAAFGAFLVSYIAIVEPSKYVVPSPADWILVEATTGLAQFVVFGMLLGLIHRRVR